MQDCKCCEMRRQTLRYLCKQAEKAQSKGLSTAAIAVKIEAERAWMREAHKI